MMMMFWLKLFSSYFQKPKSERNEIHLKRNCTPSFDNDDLVFLLANLYVVLLLNYSGKNLLTPCACLQS